MMHGAGGVVIGLLVATYVSRVILMVLGLTLVVGVAWEVFELAIGISLREPNFITDSSIDLVMDLVGAAVAYGMIQLWPTSKSALTEVRDASPDQTSS